MRHVVVGDPATSCVPGEGRATPKGECTTALNIIEYVIETKQDAKLNETCCSPSVFNNKTTISRQNTTIETKVPNTFSKLYN